MTTNLTPEERVRLIGALEDISSSMTRVEAERDLLKNIKNDICDELKLNRKVLNKLAKTFHKKNYSEEVDLHRNFEDIYETVANKNNVS